MKSVIRPGSVEDLTAISRLVEEVFDHTVAPYYSREGIRTFKGYIRPENMEERLKEGNLLLIAREWDEILGMIMTKGIDHISLFFVKEDLQGKGIGRSLMEKLIENVGKDHPDIERITVNSSPNSVTAYERLGFTIIEPERILHGISYTKMERIMLP